MNPIDGKIGVAIIFKRRKKKTRRMKKRSKN
jgi:hypothetical protein